MHVDDVAGHIRLSLRRGGAAEVLRFVEWLPGFCDQVVMKLEQEVSWAASTFPDEHGALVAAAWTELSRKTEGEFAGRMATDRMDLLMAAGGAMGGYAAAAAAVIAPASGVITAADAMMGALAPFDAVRDRSTPRHHLLHRLLPLLPRRHYHHLLLHRLLLRCLLLRYLPLLIYNEWPVSSNHKGDVLPEYSCIMPNHRPETRSRLPPTHTGTARWSPRRWRRTWARGTCRSPRQGRDTPPLLSSS